jgi:propanol-preferring alcohol dehydrogenase
MQACELDFPGPVELNPLRYRDAPTPTPGVGEILIRVSVCGVCRTDLHVVEGELPSRRSPVVPGHQVVGVIEQQGMGADRYQLGARVGVPWLHRTCGRCEYCRSGKENLCENADFTGYTVDGGYASFIVAPQDFVYPIPEAFTDEQAAPLLCAGIIGFRSLRHCDLHPGGRLGLFGFGAAAHVTIQVARHWGIEVFAFTRDERHRSLARDLGATWVGGASAEPPVKLNAAILFAPAGDLVIPALKALKKGGVLVLGGIHMTEIPPLPYELLYHERVVRSIANNTRQDGHDFFRVAAEIPVQTQVQVFSLGEANTALNALKHDGVRGAAVVQVGSLCARFVPCPFPAANSSPPAPRLRCCRRRRRAGPTLSSSSPTISAATTWAAWARPISRLPTSTRWRPPARGSSTGTRTRRSALRPVRAF